MSHRARPRRFLFRRRRSKGVIQRHQLPGRALASSQDLFLINSTLLLMNSQPRPIEESFVCCYSSTMTNMMPTIWRLNAWNWRGPSTKKRSRTPRSRMTSRLEDCPDNALRNTSELQLFPSNLGLEARITPEIGPYGKVQVLGFIDRGTFPE